MMSCLWLNVYKKEQKSRILTTFIVRYIFKALKLGLGNKTKVLLTVVAYVNAQSQIYY